MKIMLDAGHSLNGIPDPGASGNGLTEALLTDQIVAIVEKQLSGYEIEVLKTSRGLLSERAADANKEGVDYFLSVHINASPGGTGYESHIHPDETRQGITIAETIHGIMAAYYADYGFKDRGLKRSNFAVLRETKMPAILLENLFIDNITDASFLRNNIPAIGNEIAYALAQGLGLQRKTVDQAARIKQLEDELRESQIQFDAAKRILTEIARLCRPYMEG